MHSRLLSSLVRRAALVVALFGVAAFGASEPSPAKPADIIYPRATGAEANAASPAASSAPSSSALLGLALVAAGAGGWLLWRQRRSPAGLNGRDLRKLAVTETRSLGNRQYLVVADYNGRKFLLGVCPGRIDMLSTLEVAEKDTP